MPELGEVSKSLGCCQLSGQEGRRRALPLLWPPKGTRMWRDHSEPGQVGLCLGPIPEQTGSNQLVVQPALQNGVEVVPTPNVSVEGRAWVGQEAVGWDSRGGGQLRTEGYF